jgi:hypothetical protein
LICRLCGALAGLLAGLLWVPAAVAETVAIGATPVALDADDPDRQAVGRLVYVTGFRLDADHPGWGGFSDLELAADGSEFRAVSDAGWFLRLPAGSDADGRLLPPVTGHLDRLLGLDGRPMPGKRFADAEAMARLDDGSLLVAFEQRHRFQRYAPGIAPTATRPEPFPAPGNVERLPSNGGIEGLVALPRGRLLALAEEPLEAESHGIAWLFDGGRWRRLDVERSRLFKPTGAALLPGGDVLLLERRFGLIGGFAARLSRIPAAQLVPGGMLRPGVVAELSSPLTIDNFEGVAVGRGPKGETFVYLISDDNRNGWQQTLLLQFRLQDDPG